MSNNPFASFEINIPTKYQDSVKKYCRTGNTDAKAIEAPFDRQIDFWFMAFLIAVNKGLEPVKDSKTYTAITGSIFDRDPKRVSYMQLTVLGLTENFEILKDHRAVFNYCVELANAGIPELIQILSDPDDQPLWSILGELELLSKIKS